jgi:dihydroorotase
MGIIIEGKFVNHDEIFEGQVGIDIKSGLIYKVGRDEVIGEPSFIFSKDFLIFPGMIDLHIHARQDETGKENYKETYQTANDAAINGGVVLAATMPNTKKPLLTSKQLRWHIDRHKELPLDFLNYIGVGPDTNPISEDLPYKVYTGPTHGDIFFTGEGQLRNTLKRYKEKPQSYHVEDFDVLMRNKGGSTHSQRRPIECVNTALKYVLDIVEEFRIPAKLCHWSTGGESFEMIRSHRERMEKKNLPYTTVEVSPLHLINDDDTMKRYPERWPKNQMNPALQSLEDRLELIEGLRTGFVDYMATDHAPHTLDEKFKNFKDVAEKLGVSNEEAYLHLKKTDLHECQRRSCLDGTSGTPQLDSYGLVATWLMGEYGFTPQDIARVTSYNPGLFVNKFVKESYGRIEKGFQGSLTVLNMNKSTTLERSMLKTKAGWSPFEGMVFPGSVAMTIIKGIAYKSNYK